MIVTNLHKEPTALDTVLHRDLKLDTRANAIDLLAPFTSFAIALAEFAEASRDFPILFVRAAPEADGKEAVAPVIVFGLKPGENLFLKDGQWTAGYVPALLRAYPFTMARIEGSDRWAMVFDSTWRGFSRTEGTPLFDEKGEATELLNNVHRFVQDFETSLERTRQACRLLLELKLLKPMRFDATLANGETLSVDGFMTIDEEAVMKLSDKQIADLYRNGLLHVLQTHHLSLGNMRRLLDRRTAAQGAGAAA
ncbi:MAG TPA: SapC family protein [Burkholderiaceae bacterium]